MVELVVVIVVIGILGASVAMFIENPVKSYFDTIRRARLTDAADTVVRRLSRELHDAVPNSARVTAAGATVFMEFVPVRDMGRYRTESSAGDEPSGVDPLDFFDGTDATFQALGRPVVVPASAHMVVFNLGSGAFDLYGGANRRAVTTPAGSAGAIAFVATGVPLPAGSPEHRFFLVDTAVTYACTPAADGSGRIERFAGYALQAAQPDAIGAAPLATATRSLMVEGVSACNFELGNTLATLDQVLIRLQLSAGGETATLFTQVQLGSSP